MVSKCCGSYGGGSLPAGVFSRPAGTGVKCFLWAGAPGLLQVRGSTGAPSRRALPFRDGPSPPRPTRCRRGRHDIGARRTGGLDAVMERPLDEARFLAALQEVLARRKLLTSSSIRDVAQTISNREPSVELAARTILFTDVRGSTQLLETTTTQLFFKELNYKLTQQGAVVRQFSGDVVKFTGDCLMASFQRFERLSQAFRFTLS